MKSVNAATTTRSAADRKFGDDPASTCSWKAWRRARILAGGTRNRGNAAIADRPCDGCDHNRLVLRGAHWASAGTIDIVASATGKIVSSGRTKVIQPFETGVVRSIRVQDGQAVKAGDVLIELDQTMNAAERDRLHNDLLAEQLNIARLRAALAGGTILQSISAAR